MQQHQRHLQREGTHTMITLTKSIERTEKRPAHPKADGAQTRKPLDLADRAQFRVACASW